MSVDKTTQILVKSEQINLQIIDNYLHQIRRLTHYFTSVNDHLNLKTVLKNLRLVKLNIKDKNIFNERLFKVDTPFLTSSSVEYLHNNNDINFLYENKESTAWKITAEEIEFDVMLFRNNTALEKTRLAGTLVAGTIKYFLTK
jgi:hypothetical protein